MKNKFLHNWGLKLLSLLMALVLWCVVARFGDPPDTKSFGNITVRLTNTGLLDQQNKVYNVLDNTDTIRVTVSAKKSVIDNLRSSDIIAEADIAKITDINTVGIKLDVLNMDIDEITADHEVVRLNVEERRTKWVPVICNVIGEVADGFAITNTTYGQNIIEISGAQSKVSEVDRAYIELDVSGASSSVSANVEINLLTKEGNPVEGAGAITKNADYIPLQVEVLAIKEIPVEVSYQGSPASGFLPTGEIIQSLKTIKIAGSAYTLSNISKVVIPSEVLDITDKTESYTTSVLLNAYLPANVKLYENDYYGKLSLTAVIEPVVKRRLQIPIDNINFVNLPEELLISTQDMQTVCDLDVSGLAANIDPLQADAIRGEVDVAEWMASTDREKLMPGVYTFPVTFRFHEGITIVSNCTITVRLYKAL